MPTFSYGVFHQSTFSSRGHLPISHREIESQRKNYLLKITQNASGRTKDGVLGYNCLVTTASYTFFN